MSERGAVGSTIGQAILSHSLWVRAGKALVQQPEIGDTPGVAAEPVAFAGAIIVGLARSIETLSLHAAEFGVGMTLKAGLMLVPPMSATGD